MAHRGIHIVEFAYAIYNPSWFREQVGITRQRWDDLQRGTVPWRHGEVERCIALLRGRIVQGRRLTRRDIIDPDALGDEQRVLPPGRLRRSPKIARHTTPSKTTKAAVELGARTAA